MANLMKTARAADASNLEAFELDFHSLCRLCGNMNINLLSVYTDDGAETELLQKIANYLNISISYEDILPKKLCIHCSNTLASWNSFYLSCQETNSKFHTMIDVAKEPEETEAVEELEEDVEIEEHIEFLKDEENFDICQEGEFEEDLEDASSAKEDIQEDLEETSSSILVVPREHKSTQSHIYVCEICNHTTNRSNNLQRHLITHTSDNPCRVCCLSFSTKHGLKHHLARNHSQEEIEASHGASAKVNCERCSDEFSSRFQLYYHEKEVHEARTRFICSKCSQVFAEENLLNIHIQKHREYICHTCEKVLRSKKALIEHQNTHTGEKPFRCEDCGKTFGYSTNLLEHRKTHLNVKEHICGYCDKAFRRSNMLKEHERVHTKDKPYGCGFCEANFTQSNSLKKHLRKFHKSCPKCGDYVGDDIDEMIHKC